MENPHTMVNTISRAKDYGREIMHLNRIFGLSACLFCMGTYGYQSNRRVYYLSKHKIEVRSKVRLHLTREQDPPREEDPIT